MLALFYKNDIIDMLVMLSDGRIVNVEIQLYDDEEPDKKIYHYACKIENFKLKKGKKFKDCKDTIIIYLTDKDIFGKGSTVYNVDMNVVSDRGELIRKWKPGLQVMYVNTVGLTNATIHEYLKTLTDRTTLHPKYPVTSQIKKDSFNAGGESMSLAMMERMKEENKKAKAEGRVEGMQQGSESMKLNWVKYLKSQGMSDEKINTIIMEFSK